MRLGEHRIVKDESTGIQVQRTSDLLRGAGDFKCHRTVLDGEVTCLGGWFRGRAHYSTLSQCL